MKRITRRALKETDGKDMMVFGESPRPLAVELTMRSGDHTRPVRRSQEEKKDEKPVTLTLALPKIWDIFAS